MSAARYGQVVGHGSRLTTAREPGAETFSRRGPGWLFIVPRMSKTPSPQTGHVHGPDCDHDHDHGDLDPSVFLAKQPFIRQEPKVGRNDPCPCGSGKKYKKCHGT